MLSPSRITIENNGKIRPQPDGENAFAGASGGARGIRTLRDGSPPTHFPGVRLRPLGHRSVSRFLPCSMRDGKGQRWRAEGSSEASEPVRHDEAAQGRSCIHRVHLHRSSRFAAMLRVGAECPASEAGDGGGRRYSGRGRAPRTGDCRRVGGKGGAPSASGSAVPFSIFRGPMGGDELLLREWRQTTAVYCRTMRTSLLHLAPVARRISRSCGREGRAPARSYP